ncbi:MAG: hypothetical protein H7124_01050 [Phycisphaerales bacterium]|nr:hypothetical protein [Hyphomonadaceae bacterium]
MAKRGKLGALCQALLIAASVTALSVGAAHPQQANDLDMLGQRILDNPQDVDLNLRYAAAAEAAGKPRLALVAYERILINDPTNEAARDGYERLRRIIEPAYTVTRLEAGARYDTNAANLNEDFFFGVPDSTTYFAKLMIADEREFSGRRWRSILNATIEDNDEIEELNYGYLGVQTGPIFYLAPHIAAIPSIGAGIATLGDDLYFSEINLGYTLEGRATGLSYWLRLRGGYREYDPDPMMFTKASDSGPYAEVHAGFTKPHLAFERDTLTVQPFARFSSVEGDVFSFAPGMYDEFGIDVNYYYQLTDHVRASVGALLRERDFEGFDRTDTYLSPQASVTVQRLLPCDCDVRLQYRFRDNDSSDFAFSYDAEQVTLSLMTRF